MHGFLVAADAGIGTDRESVSGGNQPADGIGCAWGRVHVAVAAFQAGVGVRAMRESVAFFLMAVGAQGGHRIGHGGLCVRVVAGLALDPGFVVRAGSPFVGRILVAIGAQLGVWSDRHILGRVCGLEWPVAGLAAYASFRVIPGSGIEASRMAFQAGGLLAEL